MTQYNIIAAADFKRLKDVTVLDVRNDNEHQEQRLTRAHDLMPLGQLNPDDYMLRHGLDRNAPVYILCRGGVRARNAAEQFIAKGYTNMHVIEGGIIACAAAGEPVISGAAAPAAAATPAAIILPAERQAQLIEGVLAICGSILGYALSPVFFILPLAVGALLIHGGVTGKDLLTRKLAQYTPAPAAPAATACGMPKTTGKSAGGCA